MIRKKKDFYGMVDFRDPIFSSLFVGFDSLFENMAQMSQGSKSLPSYPPYNVIQDGDDFVIEIALAGIDKKDLNVEIQENTLTVSYQSSEEDTDKKLYKGIAQRSFKDIIQELREEHKRYKFMFRFLFCYLIFDVLIHFNILA